MDGQERPFSGRRNGDLQEDNVTDKLIDLIVDWIRDTVGEMYLDWNTEIQDYYDPGLTLKDFVEKYTKGE